MTVEFHRPLRLERVGSAGLEQDVEASGAECAALAGRFGLPAVPALACRFVLRRDPGGTIAAEGHLRARVVQVCVVSLDEFESAVEERFRVRFVPEGTETDDIDPESDDEVPYAGGEIDLGEAAAEQLALALDPYPHKRDADLPDHEAGEADSPFGALTRLRRPN